MNISCLSSRKEEEAKNAGADLVGQQDLIDKIKGGWVDFDVMITTPACMGKIGPLGKVLGPRCLCQIQKQVL